MPTTEPQTLAEFIAKHKLTHTVEWTNPTLDEMDRWHRGTGHFKVLIRFGKKRMTVRFHTGDGSNPELSTVLDCLASDANGIENNPTFAEWISEYGGDEDSRKEEKLYNATKRQSARLKEFLGADEYNELVYETGRE